MSTSPRPSVDISFRPATLPVEVTVSHARAHLPELLDDLREGGTVYLTRYGKRLAALIPAHVGERLERSEDEYWSARAREALNAEEPVNTRRIEFRPGATTALLGLGEPARRRLQRAIDGLADDTRPDGAVELAGLPGAFRINVGRHKVVYTADERTITILVADEDPDDLEGS